MIEGARNPHLSWRELVCLGQEKLPEPEGISGEQWGEPGGAGCTGRGWRLSQPRWSAPPKSREDPKGQVATLTRGPTPSLPASGTVPPATHSIVPLTHPCSPRLYHWGQRGGRRSGWPLQGLSLGGQGSQVSTHTASFPAPPRRNPECGREPSRSQRAGRVPDTKCSFGLRDAGISCLSEMLGLARRLGLGIWE